MEAVLDMEADPQTKAEPETPLEPVRFLDYLFQRGWLLFTTPRTVIAPFVVSTVGGDESGQRQRQVDLLSLRPASASLS